MPWTFSQRVPVGKIKRAPRRCTLMRHDELGLTRSATAPAGASRSDLKHTSKDRHRMHGTMMKLDCTNLADPFGQTVFHRLKPDTYSIRGVPASPAPRLKVVAAGHVGFHPTALPTELPTRNFSLLWDYDFRIQPDLMREQVHAVCADAA